jgi:hypothetical protein
MRKSLVLACLLAACSGKHGGAAAPDAPPSIDAAPVCVLGQTALHWTFAFPLYADNSCITEFQLGGFRIGYGPMATQLTNTIDVPLTSCMPSGQTNACGPILSCTTTVSGLAPAIWFFAIADVRADGTQDAFSSSSGFDLTCPDLSGCPDMSSKVAHDRGFYITDPSGVQVWGYVAGDPVDFYRINVSDSTEHGGPSTPGMYPIAAKNGDNFTCDICITVYRGDKTFMPMPGGTITLTTLDSHSGGHFAGRLDQVMLQEVTIDAQNLVTTPVPNGEHQCLTGYPWDVVME